MNAEERALREIIKLVRDELLRRKIIVLQLEHAIEHTELGAISPHCLPKYYGIGLDNADLSLEDQLDLARQDVEFYRSYLTGLVSQTPHI